MVRWVYHVLCDNCILVEMLRLRDERRARKVDGVPQAVKETIPGLRDAIVGHFGRDQVGVFFSCRRCIIYSYVP